MDDQRPGAAGARFRSPRPSSCAGAPVTRAGRMPSRKRLGRDPDCEAAPLLERPIVLRPVADLVARPRDLMTARLMDLVGHRSSGERGDGLIRSTVALPKPEAVNLHQRPAERNSVTNRVVS